ncbi:MAG: phage tail tape measure protein [Peptococcaceae bacterium]|nr:phage tail tape measure protein [Peptococcaceae bacterium]
MMDSLYALGVVFSVMDKFTGPVKNMAQTLSKFESNIEKAKGMIDFGNKMAISGVMVQGAANKISSGLLNVLEPTRANQKALGELASLGTKNLQAISNEATKFSKHWSGTTEDQFIAAAYDIKSGISSLTDEAVGQFTAMAALTGKATKATTAEMTSLFATGYGIYKDLYANLTDFEFGEMFSAGIAASVKEFKTTGSGMSQALTTLGAAATTARRPFEEQLAVLGMLQATMPGGEAGTKYKAFIQNAAKAGKELGLSFVDGNNQLLGMTQILDKLRSKYGDTLDAMEKQEIQKAFGSEEAVALIDLFYGKVGSLRGSIDTLGGAIRKGTAFTEEMARAMESGVGEELDLMAQNYRILKREIGDELAPLVKAFLPTVKEWVGSFQSLAKSHPTLVRTALLLASIGAVSLAILAPIILISSGIIMLAGHVIWGFSKIGQAILWSKKLVLDFGVYANRAFNLIRFGGARAYLAIRAFTAGLARMSLAAIRTAYTALPGLIAAVWSFTAALLANPITWVILAIIALGAAIYILWRNWDVVIAAIGRAWDWLKTAIPQTISEIIQAIRAKFGEFAAAGQALIETFTAGIVSVISKPVEVVKEGLAKVRELLPFSDAKTGPLSTLTRSGMAFVETFASGIEARSGLLKLVAAEALAGAVLSGGDSLQSLSGSPRVRIQEFIRETVRESSRDTRLRPLIFMVNSDQVRGKNPEDLVDLAYRYLSMSTD